MRHRYVFCLSATCFLIAGAVCLTTYAGIADRRSAPDPAKSDDRPFLALWRDHEGMVIERSTAAPYLRFAVWADGRVLFAKDPGKWSHELLRGRISASRVGRLQAALRDAGVFDLKGTAYLVPDAPTDCLTVDLGDKWQMLSWDEVEAPGYGINTNPKPHHLEFKRCWKMVNHLALVALPDDGEPVAERFTAPKSWYLKRAIQSE